MSRLRHSTAHAWDRASPPEWLTTWPLKVPINSHQGPYRVQGGPLPDAPAHSSLPHEVRIWGNITIYPVTGQTPGKVLAPSSPACQSPASSSGPASLCPVPASPTRLGHHCSLIACLSLPAPVRNGQSFCSAFSGCMWWAGSCSLPLFHGLIQQFRSIIKIKYACYNRLAYNSFNFHLSLIWTPQGKKERREKGRMGGGKKLLCTFA